MTASETATRQIRRLWGALGVTWALVLLTVGLGFAATRDVAATWGEMRENAAALEEELERVSTFSDALEERIAGEVETARGEIGDHTRAAVEREAAKRVGDLVAAGERALKRTAELSDTLERSAAEMNAKLDQRFNETADKLDHLVDHKVTDTTLRVENGSIELSTTKLRSGTQERSERRRVTFDQPFHEPPRVALALRMLDLPRTDRPRVSIDLVKVTERGFDYEVRTWGRSTVWEVSADWVAFGKTGTDANAPSLVSTLAKPHPR